MSVGKNILYLVGGASRSGKSVLSQKILEEHCIPRFSTDYLMMALDQSVPEMGVSHTDKILSRAEKMWPVLCCMLKSISWSEPSYLVEGEALLPLKVKNLINEWSYEVRCCFLGYPNADKDKKIFDIRNFPGSINNWARDKDDAFLTSLVNDGIAFSKILKDQCRECDMAFFDVSEEYESGIRAAYDFIMERG